jgi:hypothetical protein
MADMNGKTVLIAHALAAMGASIIVHGRDSAKGATVWSKSSKRSPAIGALLMSTPILQSSLRFGQQGAQFDDLPMPDRYFGPRAYGRSKTREHSVHARPGQTA